MSFGVIGKIPTFTAEDLKVTFEPKRVKVDLLGMKPLLYDWDLVNEINGQKSSFKFNQRDGLKLQMRKAKPGLLWNEVFSKDRSDGVPLPSYSEVQDNIKTGDQVEVQGLVNAAQYNGMVGQITGWNTVKGRFEVKLQNGKEVSVKQVNLLKLKTDQFNNPMLNLNTSKEELMREL